MVPADSHLPAPASSPAPAPTSSPTPAPPRALSFDRAAAQYAAARPGYPPALFDAVEELAHRPLHGARTIDVGAGTGISTRLLHERGALVTAVEPGSRHGGGAPPLAPRAARRTRRRQPPPLATASADLITYAQSWHWTDRTLATAEALRVLRPGGALALWWNVSDHSVPWIDEQDTRLRRFFGAG